MSWSSHLFARRLIALGLGLAVLAMLPVLAGMLCPQSDSGFAFAQTEDDEPSDTGEKSRSRNVIQEIIIDDSGIVVLDGDDEIQMDIDDGDPSNDDYGDPYSITHDYSDDEQFTFGEDVYIDEDEVINQDIVILFGDLEVYGRVIGDIVVIMGDVNLYEGCEVTGDILCVGGEVESESGAGVFGEITPISMNFLNLVGNDWGEDWLNFGTNIDDYTFGKAVIKLFQILALAGVGLLLLAKRIPNLTIALKRRPGRSFLIGLLSLIVGGLLMVPAALLIILLVLTVVGIPVAVLAILTIVGLCYISLILPIFSFSRYTFEKRGMNRFMSVAIWAAIFWFLFSLGQSGPLSPMFNVLQFLIFLFGMGALVMTRLGTRAVVTE